MAPHTRNSSNSKMAATAVEAAESAGAVAVNGLHAAHINGVQPSDGIPRPSNPDGQTSKSVAFSWT
jgi:hypothetical protein